MDIQRMRAGQGKRIVTVDGNEPQKPAKAAQKPKVAPTPPKPKKPPLTVAARDQRLEMKPRLPCGSTILAVYDAKEKLWTGSIEVPGYGYFGGSNSGIFGLLEKLDDAYRRSLEATNG